MGLVDANGKEKNLQRSRLKISWTWSGQSWRIRRC